MGKGSHITPAGRRFTLVASLVGALAGGRWLGMVLLVTQTSCCTAVDLGAGVAAFVLTSLHALLLEVWGPGGWRARLLFVAGIILGGASVPLI